MSLKFNLGTCQWVLGAVAALLLVAVQPVAAQSTHLKKTIAVSEFESRVSNFQGGAGMAEMLTNALIQSKRFVVLERQVINQVLDEQDFAASNRTAKALKSAETGKVIPSQLLIIGTITEYAAATKGSGGGLSIMGIRLNKSKSSSHIGLIIRIVDSTTGEVLDSVSVEGEASAGAFGGDACYGDVCTGGSSNTAQTTAQATEGVIQDAVDEIIERTKNIPFKGKLIRVDGSTLYANAGGRNGAKPGDTLSVYSPGVELIDPDTGESLGNDMSKVGSIKLVDVQEKFSRAVKVTGGGFQKGHILQPSSGGGSDWD
jgi:curli biogenesis system outer membrane secretion channel CsgG